MNPTLVNALWITLIGMSLVFIALLLLWGLMALIVSATAKQAAAEVAALGDTEEEQPAAETLEEVPDGQPGVSLLDSQAVPAAVAAAAAAVAVAMALQKKGQTRAAAAQVGEPFSAWQSVLRANRLTQKSRMYTRKERGNGK